MLRPGLAALLFALVSMTAAMAAGAVEIHGVRVAEAVPATDGGTLVLNGAGTRSKFFVKVYVAALYLAERKKSAEAVLSDPEAKQVSLHFLRELSAEKLGNALDEGLAANNGVQELASLDAQLKEFRGLLTAGGTVREGHVIVIDYSPASGTRVSLNGKLLGTGGIGDPAWAEHYISRGAHMILAHSDHGMMMEAGSARAKALRALEGKAAPAEPGKKKKKA